MTPDGSTPPRAGGDPSQAPGGYSGTPRHNTKAVTSLVLGIVGLLCCAGLLAGIPAIVLGRIAKTEIAGSHGVETGDGLATGGIILGIVATAGSLIYGALIATGAVEPFSF